MRSRLLITRSRQEREGAQQHPVGKRFIAEMARVVLSVEERARFEEAYYEYWIGIEDKGEGGGVWYQ